MNEYLEARLRELTEDMGRSTQEHDKKWYNRLIQELDWARQLNNGKFTNDCYMENTNG